MFGSTIQLSSKVTFKLICVDTFEKQCGSYLHLAAYLSQGVVLAQTYLMCVMNASCMRSRCTQILPQS